MSKREYQNIRSGKEGYTLIEIVIVMMITAVVFVGIYSLFSKSLRYESESRYEIVAGELAQEGVEIVKNKKEENELRWALWNPAGSEPEPKIDDDIPSADFNPRYNFAVNNIEFYTNTNYFKLQFNNNDQEYKVNCSGESCVGPIFIRDCEVRKQDLNGDGDDDSIRVICTVRWKSLLLGGGERKVVAETVLTDWER